MRTTSVICRFLSLLDVTLILLGLTMILMAHSQIAAEQKSRERESGGPGRLPALDTVYLFAATAGPENGKCFPLGPDRRPDLARPVRTDVPDDVKAMFGAGNAGTVRVAVLLISAAGFDSLWPADRLRAMESAWGVKVVPVYNFSFEAESGK
jgi:hypothetical protein